MKRNVKTWSIAIGAVLLASPLALGQSFGDGTHLVGSDIQAGTYRAPGGEYCMWERLSGLSGSMSDYLAGDVPTGRAVVEIKSTDKAFKVEGCGRWALVDGTTTTAVTPETRELVAWKALYFGFLMVFDVSPSDVNNIMRFARYSATKNMEGWSSDDVMLVTRILEVLDNGLMEMATS